MAYRRTPSAFMSPNTEYSGSHGLEALNDSRNNICKSEYMVNSNLRFVNYGGGKIRTGRKKYKRRTGRKKYKRRTGRTKYKIRAGRKKYKRRTGRKK